MHTSTTPSIAHLLEHAAWLKQLAGHLVFESDDLLQDTWLAALRSPPDAARPPRPWLSRVLKNAARRRHRDASLRREHEVEAATAPTPTIPTPEDLLAHAETQRLLAELVLELAEPYRRIVLLRYHEGLSAAEIARAMGIPAGTVRWQLKEGIDRLRGALDSRFGNDRQAWALALTPLAAVPRGHTSMMGAGLAIAKTKVAAIALSLAVLASLGFAWRASPQRPAHTPLVATAGAPRNVLDIRKSAPVARILLERPAQPAASAPAKRPWNLPKIIDRRERPGPNAQQELETAAYYFQAMDDDVSDCLSQWGKLEPNGPQEITMAFTVSKEGLQKAWLDGAPELPFGARTCFATAAYGLDWSNLVDEPAELTEKFSLRP